MYVIIYLNVFFIMYLLDIVLIKLYIVVISKNSYYFICIVFNYLDLLK